jgi:hypothetical protein
MLKTSTDSRTRAQRYADRRWWHLKTADGYSVKVVGYAIHRPEFDWDDGSRVYSVELLYFGGTRVNRWVCVSQDADGSGCIYDVSGLHRPLSVPRTWRHELAERSAS